MSSIKLGGRILFEGKLDVVVVTRRMSRRDILDLSREYQESSVPLVAFQVDNLDNVENYFIKGKWVKPKSSVCLVDGVKLVARHLGVDISINKMVLDCMMLGRFLD